MQHFYDTKMGKFTTSEKALEMNVCIFEINTKKFVKKYEFSMEMKTAFKKRKQQEIRSFLMNNVSSRVESTMPFIE